MQQESYTDTTHATASPGSDAPTLRGSAGWVSNMLAEPFYRRRQDVNVAYWNVRTMRDSGTQALTIHSLWKYGIDIACLSETRLADSGHTVIKVPQAETHYHLYHSGVMDNSGLHGVAIALSQPANAALLEWRPISSRMAKIRLKGEVLNLTIIAVYAPTLQSSDDSKDEFYSSLQNAVSSVPSQDMLIVAGDWNARVGPTDPSLRHIVGKFSVGDKCANGDRLITFAANNHLTVANTRFQHPKHHLVTWYSPDGHTANQIDHMLIRSRWASSALDCRAYRGADTGSANGSDHVMVRARVRMRLKAQRRRHHFAKLDVAKLKTEAGDQLRLELNNRFSALSTLDQTAHDSDWEYFRTSVSQAAKTHLGYARRRQKDWVSSQTVELANQMQQLRAQSSENYRELRRLTTRSLRKDKNEHWKGIAVNIESAARHHDSRKLYQILHSVSKKVTAPPDVLLSRNGTSITDNQSRCDRWTEHFNELLNHSPPPRTASYDSSPTEVYPCRIQAPSVEEVCTVIGQLKNNKAPGEDGIPPEILKDCIGPLGPWLHQVILRAWESETLPNAWGKAVLLPIFKKGDKRICTNYRGISLIDVAAKVFSALILKRFQAERDKRTRPNQSGFRPGRGCIDQIHNLRRILEQRWRYQQGTCICFVDFAAAFDSVDRQSLWKIMAADGMPPKLLRLIQAYYDSSRTKVRADQTESDYFDICSGVKQGCVLSPILFNYVIDWVLTNALAPFNGVQAGVDVCITDLAYADDVVLLAESFDEMQRMVNAVERCAETVGLQINAAKTKILSSLLPNEPTQSVMLAGHPIEEVETFKYLGSIFGATGQSVWEVNNRINLARVAFNRLKSCLWVRREISLKTKGRIYQALIRSILLYGCETWPLRKSDVHQLEVFDNDCIRAVSNYRRTDRMRMDLLRSRMGIFSLSPHLLQRRLKWFGHAARRPNSEFIRKLLLPPAPPDWRMRVGGQLKTWASTLKKDLTSLLGPTIFGLRRWNNEWLQLSCELASDRKSWSAAIRDAVNVAENAGDGR